MRGGADDLDHRVEAVRKRLEDGVRPSTIANELNASGVGNIGIIYIFRCATGAGIAEVKSLGQWWSPTGVTDADAFDAYAARIFGAQASGSNC